MIKNLKESTVLIEHNFIVEVGQSMSAKGEYAKYVEWIVRGKLAQNKQSREVIDMDALEPEADMAKF